MGETSEAQNTKGGTTGCKSYTEYPRGPFLLLIRLLLEMDISFVLLYTIVILSINEIHLKELEVRTWNDIEVTLRHEGSRFSGRVKNVATKRMPKPTSR